MRNQYSLPKVKLEKMIAFVILLLIPSLSLEIHAQSLKITATGTGQSSGNIALISITNTTGSTVRINPQTCFIPSDGKYQSYVATIPDTSVPPGTSYLNVKGYCANVFALPVPDGNPLPLVSAWIPVIQPGINVPKGGTNILGTPPMPAFKPEDVRELVQSPGYTAISANPSSTTMTTWPKSNIPFEGTINTASHPKPFAPVMVEAINSIAKAFDDMKDAGNVNTPYSGESEKEREAIIQHTFWMYTAQITGSQYQKEQFRQKVIKQFEDNSDMAVENLSQEEMEKLERGIDVFWNTFINTSIEANLLIGTQNTSGSASTRSTLLPPWDKIELTDVRMKPANPYAIAGAAGFPWVPVIAGAVGAGTLVYLLSDSKEEDDPVDCAFTASAIPTSSTCGLSNGSITLNVMPPGSYSYQWSNGGMSQNLNNIPAGNYSVTVTSVGTTCIQVVQAAVTNDNESFNATISAQDADCDQPNGSVSVTTSPPGAYTYLWSNGATTQNQSNLPAGNYTVTISAGGTCEQLLSTQIGTKPFEPSVAFNIIPATCGRADGAVTISVNPPDQYTYAWSNGQSGSSISSLASGSYSVTVSKPGTACVYVDNVMVEDIPIPFSVSLTSTMSGCGLSNGTANATVDPPGSYDFIWSNGQTGPQATGLAAGTYTVTVSITGSSCSEEASVTITESAASFVVSLTSTPAGCGLSDGTATAIVSPPGPYIYSWSNGQSGAQIADLAPGNYTVTVTLGGEVCTQQGSITVDSTPLPNEISIATTPSSCGGSDGTATVIITPPGEFNYQWSNGQTGSQLSDLNPGTYTVTVTIPGTNCSKEATTTVEELPAAFTVNVTTSPAGCGLNTGSATATVDPAGTYDYAWSNGQTGSQLTGVMGGSYTVTVSVAGTTCSQVVSTIVEQLPPSFNLSFNSSPSGCGLNNGSAVVNVTPSGTYTYLWSNGSQGMQITNVGPGTYTVTVTITGTSCSTSGSVTVGQTGGGFTASFTTENADCGLANGSAIITVSPPGDYTYLWSNQQTGPMLQQVGAGTYTVTVSDNDACTEAFSISIEEDIAEYISILNTTQATCIGGGNIKFVVTTPGTGPLEIEVVGPGGTTMITVGVGIYDLSSFITVFPGTYTLTVTDQQIGPLCSETVSATITDITPPIELLGDFYSVEGSNPLMANALDNDEGFNLQMTQVDNEIGGTVTYMPNGDFVFIADFGFSGEASFIYTVTDACGNTSTAMVTIFVEEVPCDIQVDFDSTSPSCGLEDGIITVIISEPGEYDYEWSNGDEGASIQNVPPGGYIVTITDLNLGCTFEATYILEGLPADYVEDIVLIQPSCEAGGDIEFMALSPGQNTLSMLVQHPLGAADFDIEAGLIRISDYVTTVPGEYTIEVSDPAAGPGCSESFTVTLIEPPLPVIEVVEVFPPSGPGAMDGSAFVQVIVPGQLPYAVYVDGFFSFTVNQNNFFLLGLSPGVHTVHLVDIVACQSNTVQFVIPQPTEIFSFGVSITDAGPYSTSNEQPSLYHPGNVWQTVLSGSYRFDIRGVQQVVRVLYAPSRRINIEENLNGFIAMEYLSGPDDFKWKGIGFRAQAGVGTYFIPNEPALNQAAEQFYWLLRASMEYKVFKRILLTGSVSARGLDYIAPVSWEFGFRVPFYSWNKGGSG